MGASRGHVNGSSTTALSVAPAVSYIASIFVLVRIGCKSWQAANGYAYATSTPT